MVCILVGGIFIIGGISCKFGFVFIIMSVKFVIILCLFWFFVIYKFVFWGFIMFDLVMMIFYEILYDEMRL